LQPIFRLELHAALLLLEENAANLRAIIFQREVVMTGHGRAAIGDFALNGYIREVFRQQVANPRRQITDGENSALRLQIKLKLAHSLEPNATRQARKFSRLLLFLGFSHLHGEITLIAKLVDLMHLCFEPIHVPFFVLQ